MNIPTDLSELYYKCLIIPQKRIGESDFQNPPTTVKAKPQNDGSLPKKAVGAKQRNSIDCLVDYGTDDDDTVEESPPLYRASPFVEVPRSQEATTEDARESQTTTTMNDAVVKIEPPTSNGPKFANIPPRHTKPPPTGPKALRDHLEASNPRNSALIRHRYDPNFAPTSSQLNAPAPVAVHTTSSVVKTQKPPRPTPSLSAITSSTNIHSIHAPLKQTYNPRTKSYPNVTNQRTPALAPRYSQRPMQGDVSIGGGYDASNCYAGQPSSLSTLRTSGFTGLSNPHGQWPNQYAHGSWEPYRNNSRVPPQGVLSEYWYEQESRASQGGPGMPGIGIFTAPSTYPHQGAGNLRQISAGPRADLGLPYPSDPTTTMKPTIVCPIVQPSLPMGAEMSQEVQPQMLTAYDCHTSAPFPPFSTQSPFPNYQIPVSPSPQHSVLNMELPPVRTRDPFDARADVAKEENPSQGCVQSEPTEPFDTLPTPITPSVLQLPNPPASSPPKGLALPTIADILSPVPEPYKRNVFSRMQEVAYDSPDLATVLSEAESEGRPVIVRKFPLCTWWENTPLNPRNLQRILEKPIQPCTEPKNGDGPPPRCFHLNAVSESIPQAACLSSYLPADIKFQTLSFNPHSPTNPAIGAPIVKYPCGAVTQDLLTHDDSNHGRIWLSTSTNDSNLFRYALHQSGLQPEALERGLVHLTVDQIREVCTMLDVSGRHANPENPEEITIYVCEQKRGDLVITPARSWAQASTYGDGDAASVSWMRFPFTSVDLALRLELPVLHRLCIPETFHIKSMLYHYLKVHTTNPDRVTAMAPALNFRDITSLFDRVLAEEYIPIPFTTGCSQVLLSCDFCSASLFTSGWVCGCPPDSREACARAGADASPKRVCCFCYVEGRKCACGHMTVQTFVDMGELLELRNAFVSLVTSSGDTDIVPHTLSTNHLLNLSGARLIGHGSLLFAELESSHDAIERRKKIVNGKEHRLSVVCTPKTDERHDVSSFSALQCHGGPNDDTSACSDSLCFTHLASIGFHSSAALQYLEFPAAFHYAHTQLAEEWLEWTRSSWSLRGWANEQSYNLACIAQIYRKCKSRSSGMRAGFYDIVEVMQGNNTGGIEYCSVALDECLPYVDKIGVASAQHRSARDKEEPETQADQETEPEEKAHEQIGSRKRKSDVLDMEVTTQSSTSSPNPPGTPSVEPQHSVTPPIKRSRKHKTEDEELLDTGSIIASTKGVSKEQSRGSSVAEPSVASNTTNLDHGVMELSEPPSNLTVLGLEESPTPETRTPRQKKATKCKSAVKRAAVNKKVKGKAFGKRTKKSTLAHSFTAEEMDSHSIREDSSIGDADKEVGSGMMPLSSSLPSTPLHPSANDWQPSLESIHPPPPPIFSAPLLPTPPPNEGDKPFGTPPSDINGTDLRTPLRTQESYDQVALTEIVKALAIERERLLEESERRRDLEQQLLRERDGRMQDRLECERLRDLSKGWQTRMPSLEEDNRKLLDLHYSSQKKLDQVIKERDEIVKERNDLNTRNYDLSVVLKDQDSKHMEALANQEKKYLDLQARYERLLEKQDQAQFSLPETLPDSRATSGAPGFGQSSRGASRSFSPVRSRTSSHPPCTPDRRLSRSSHHSPSKLGRPGSLVSPSSAETEGEEDEINMLGTLKQ